MFSKGQETSEQVLTEDGKIALPEDLRANANLNLDK
jgi:hypothetical protein